MNVLRYSLLATTAMSLIVVSAAASAGDPANAGHRPRTVQSAANPCAAGPCGANPCRANPCRANPCAARKPANPCAASNPCGPCAAAAAATDCVVPRLADVAKANPCASRKPCRPCAPRNPCNPGAARNPCNPCAARNPCNPCNPCAAEPVGPPNLTEAEAAAAYECVGADMATLYRRSGHAAAHAYRRWTRFSRVPYPAEAHGIRFMNNYANAVASDAYARYEKAGAMPVGSVLAKDSFIVAPDGAVSVGPLFVMTKQRANTSAATRDWLYEQVLPDGSVRREAEIQRFCNNCHRRAGARDDYLMFLPLPYRTAAPSRR